MMSQEDAKEPVVSRGEEVERVVERFGLAPHPEGGYFREVYRAAAGGAWSFGGCTVAPGFDFADFEMPSAEDLLRQHPQHEAIVRELTRR